MSGGMSCVACGWRLGPGGHPSGLGPASEQRGSTPPAWRAEAAYVARVRVSPGRFPETVPQKDGGEGKGSGNRKGETRMAASSSRQGSARERRREATVSACCMCNMLNRPIVIRQILPRSLRRTGPSRARARTGQGAPSARLDLAFLPRAVAERVQGEPQRVLPGLGGGGVQGNGPKCSWAGSSGSKGRGLL